MSYSNDIVYASNCPLATPKIISQKKFDINTHY